MLRRYEAPVYGIHDTRVRLGHFIAAEMIDDRYRIPDMRRWRDTDYA